MDVDLASVKDEVVRVFQAYEKALVDNDVSALTGFFWKNALTLRYGAAENLYGSDAIEAFRKGRPAGPRPRTLGHVVITTHGTDVATANAEFTVPDDPRLGRQSQTWVRMPEGWRIVAAHVSFREGAI